jgi:redox-regulated HSP33 family molecular chaperone
MKCDICREKVETLFLEKIKGTYIGKGKKKKVICQHCQKQYTMDEIRKKLKE